MFDFAALEAVGFSRLSEEDWLTEVEAQQESYGPGSEVALDYIMRRPDGVQVMLEQNTRRQVSGGLEATVAYPQVAIISGPRGRAACDPSNTELILRLVGEVAAENVSMEEWGRSNATGRRPRSDRADRAR
jgi:hypothetical protein